MSREIKFRVFDRSIGQLFDDVRLHGNLNVKLKSSNIVFMQYTGLKNKNGVEIYEGDIIDDHIGIGVVVWWQRNAAFKVSYIGENSGKGKWFVDYLDSEYKTIKVIGNVYENSELLEQVK